ncbi:MAG TPA: hypothetical protein VFO85_13685 [Vicinamibacteria bacterium]|nr:hypothetical protein [Vicinamibacteria bacterium]
MGVRGWALSSSGEAVGVYGKSESTSGIGVRGEATFLVGGTNPSYGVEGLNHRDQGAGVRGQGPTLGVEGAATANFGIVSGVHGTSSSTQGRGVQGTATAASGQPHGVYGSATSPSGIGVGGYATATTGLNFGVFGSTTSASGYAGYFSGRVQMSSSLNVLGNLSVGGIKNFKIDHPLDPAHKYLVHASVESSEMLNIYSGTVVLDAQGAATVQLPEWFEALNRDFRYQLTCVGGYAPVYISAKVRQGRFGIAGGMPGLEVSWQVTGVRSDAHALAHPMAVEEEKPLEERGTYLDPEAHGQPAALARDYKITSALPRE